MPFSNAANNAMRLQIPTAARAAAPPTTSRTASAATNAARWCAATSRATPNSSPASCAPSATRSTTPTGNRRRCERLTARAYDVTVLLENLEGCALVDNELLRHIVLLPTDERRATFVVMLCQSFTTGDERSAYAWSVDMLINYQDIGQFGRWWSR